MKFNKKTVVVLFFLSFGLTLWAGEGQSQKKETAKKEEQSLIKKELLSKTKKKLAPARRNIFSLRSGGSQETPVVPTRSRTAPQQTTPRMTEPESLGSSVNIRYIGHIRSGQKIVALIVYENAALAVEKGELISEGVQIGEVTPTYVEIVGPDSVRRKYTLEGEKE